MSDITLPTVDELASNESLLRRVAGEVLGPVTHGHKWVRCLAPDHRRWECARPGCGAFHEFSDVLCEEEEDRRIPLLDQEVIPCFVPDPAQGSLADIAEQLSKAVQLSKAIEAVCPLDWPYAPDSYVPAMARWLWFGVATPTERILCVLVAFGKARIGE